MHEARIHEALQLLGMDAPEARAYEHLATAGAMDAAALARGLGVTRGHAYRALTALVRRGHVALEATEPVSYRAIDPAEHAQVAGVAEERRAAALVSARAAFVAAVSAAQVPSPPTHAPWKVRRVTGRHAFHAAARRLIMKARSSVLISYANCATEADERARGSLLDAADERARDGVRARIVTRPPASPGSPRGLDAPVFFVIDGRECLFLSSDRARPGTASQGCWTSAAPLVAIAEMLHAELWQAVDLAPAPISQDVIRAR